MCVVFVVKQKAAYEMRISDWSSDVCSSDLIARDLVEEAVRLEKDRRREAVRAAAEEAAMERLLDALTGKGASEATRQSFRQRIREGHLDDSEVEIAVADAPRMSFELTGQPGKMSMINMSDMPGQANGGPPTKRRKLNVIEA